MKPVIQSLAMAASLLSVAAQAQVAVKDVWVRATVAHQKATGAFMQLSAPKEMKLIAAGSPVAPSVEVHEMAMHDNVMRMRQIPAIKLPAGKVVELSPGGYHVMLMDLNRQMKEGDTVPLTLVFEDSNGKRETMEVRAQVRALNSASPSPAHTEQRR